MERTVVYVICDQALAAQTFGSTLGEEEMP